MLTGMVWLLIAFYSAVMGKSCEMDATMRIFFNAVFLKIIIGSLTPENFILVAEVQHKSIYAIFTLLRSKISLQRQTKCINPVISVC